MSPQFEYNPAKASASVEVLDPGDHELIIGKPKAFQKEEGGVVKNFGVRYAMQTEDGKKVYPAFYLHTDGSIGMLKRFQMAALGYKNTKAEEARFDREHSNDDWRCDFASGDCGEGWQQFDGARVIVVAEVVENKNTGEPQNNWKSWRPIG